MRYHFFTILLNLARGPAIVYINGGNCYQYVLNVNSNYELCTSKGNNRTITCRVVVWAPKMGAFQFHTKVLTAYTAIQPSLSSPLIIIKTYGDITTELCCCCCCLPGMN